jgi:methionyl-tRNA formyltransferase
VDRGLRNPVGDMTDINNRLLVMTAGGVNPNVMINALAARFPDIHVFMEQPESKSAILKRRARRLGWIVAVGQLATMVASRLGKRFTVRRSKEIIAEHGLLPDLGGTIPVTHFASLNDEECRKAANLLKPAVIFTISCRLLTPATLRDLHCPIINFHAGINPAYRGQMGGYWALVEKDRGNFGATVHLVDKGVDTGATLYEKRLKPSPSDTIATYPLLLTAASVDIAINAIEDALSGSLAPQPPSPGKSVLRFPPTIWTWLWNGLTKRVW